MDKSLEISGRVKPEGRSAGVDAWAVEKLVKVVEGAVTAHGVPMDDAWVRNRKLTEGLYEAYRNACKLAAWMADHTGDYREEDVEAAFLAGKEAMLALVEGLLSPILRSAPGTRTP